MNALETTNKLKSYVGEQLTLLSKSNPLIGIIKPFASRALDKNINKITKMLNLISDEDGNIDIEGILSEIIENITTSEPYELKTAIGDIGLGGGVIKVNIPFTDKKLMFDKYDLEAFKNTLISKE